MPDAIGAMTQRMAAMGGFGGVGGGLGGLGGLDTGARTVPALGGEGTDGASFGETLKGFVNQVSDAQDAAGELRGQFLRGENVELHQVMAAGEEAGLAIDLMVELRNKVVEAYRTLVAIQG